MQDSSPVQDSPSSSKRIRVDFNLENLLSDPGLRQKISSYHPNNHDEIRRHYLTKGPCQPAHDFPLSNFSGKPRQFISEWYVGRKWLDSIDKDAAFCFYCYLFGQDVGKQGGGETFVTKGFKLWNQLVKLESHVGGVNSAHNQAVKKGEDLLNEKQHIQRLAFCGHDESQGSSDKGNFLELLQFLGDHNESLKEVLQNAPKNCKLTHSDIQKNIVNAIACETSKVIIKDLDNGNLVTAVGGSCKRRDALRDAQFAKIKKDLENGVRRSGQVSGRPRRNTQQNTNLHHYLVELFYTVIDMQLQELNNRFSEVNTDLLLCMACLNPSNSFVAFHKEVRLAKFYPSDFLGTNILALDSQLQNYIFDMHSNDFFLEFQGVRKLAEKLVSTRKHETYPLVYLLVKLALTLPVATATVERSFSGMKYIKNEMRNRMGDQWMNDCLVVFGFGAVIRNKKGEIIAAMAAKGPEVFCSEEAELLACRKAIEFAIDAGFSELVIEGDNGSVMKAISATQDDHSMLGNVIWDIHHLIGNLQWVMIECTKRGRNRVAHELTQFARNISHDLFWMEDVPPIVREALYQDSNFSI
ncbi:uncharacterized protein LOC142608964 [Castanea sativa]|uniref:uncharacterized protein LOC142608964 n=1 Tax=Castanea sativa TaxID=21020 RepID=UPI003F64B5D2